MAEVQEQGSIEKRQAFLRELYLAGYEKAAGFMALIVTAGYAAAFTVWDKVEHYLTYPERMLTACLFLISLVVFIGWQIRGQWVLSQQQMAISIMAGVATQDFEALTERFRADQTKLRAQLQRQLPLIFSITVGFGALGMVVLFIICLQHFVVGH